MASPESPSERPEKSIDTVIKSLKKLSDELLTTEFLTELKKKTPEEINKYKNDTLLDFEQLNLYFNSIDPKHENKKNKIVSIMAPIFDAMDKGSPDSIMQSFLSGLLPPRSFIQDYYNGER